MHDVIENGYLRQGAYEIDKCYVEPTYMFTSVTKEFFNIILNLNLSLLTFRT